MSQHFFETIHNDKPTTIVMGWDRRRASYFMFIEADEQELCGYLYDSDTDPQLLAEQRLAATPEHFTATLKELGLPVPETMVEQVKRDASANAGDRLVWYHPNGGIRVDHPG